MLFVKYISDVWHDHYEYLVAKVDMAAVAMDIAEIDAALEKVETEMTRYLEELGMVQGE